MQIVRINGIVLMAGKRFSNHQRRLVGKQHERETLRDEMRHLQAEMDFLRDVLIFKQQQLRCLNKDIACLSRLVPVSNVLPGRVCDGCLVRRAESKKTTSRDHLVCVK